VDSFHAQIDHRQPTLHQGQEDGLLGGKVVIESTFADPGLSTNFIHAGGVVAGNGKPFNCGIQDATACFFSAMLGHAKLLRDKHTDWSVCLS
jgi:hypothetical protein